MGAKCAKGNVIHLPADAKCQLINIVCAQENLLVINVTKIDVATAVYCKFTTINHVRNFKAADYSIYVLSTISS